MVSRDIVPRRPTCINEYRNRIFEPLEGVRAAALVFVAQYNASWPLEKNGVLSPSEARAAWNQANLGIAAQSCLVPTKPDAEANMACLRGRLSRKNLRGLLVDQTPLCDQWEEARKSQTNRFKAHPACAKTDLPSRFPVVVLRYYVAYGTRRQPFGTHVRLHNHR